MSTVYFDCTTGVSGDMVLGALTGLCADPQEVSSRIAAITAEIDALAAENHTPGQDHHNGHDHAHARAHGSGEDQGHGHSHGPDEDHGHRSYGRVMGIIRSLNVAPEVKETALSIYAVVAAAESKVHEAPLDDLHFHEVGRNKAIANITGVAFCYHALHIDRLICSGICDGQGTVQCAHGVLEVPVPAVRAMLESCDLAYRQTEHDGEMVTPSGLAMLIGLGAVTGERPAGTPVRESEAKGRRAVSGSGLKAYLFETKDE